MRLFIAAVFLMAFQVQAANHEKCNHARPQAIQIADYVNDYMEFNFMQTKNSTGSYVIESPNASFIKVHFEYFNLPDGAFVEVSNPAGTEVYRYGMYERDDFTYDEAMGEDGITRFASLSITGSTAIVRLIDESEKTIAPRFRGYGVVIGQYLEGYPNDMIEMLYGESLYDENLMRKDWTSPEDPSESTCGANQRFDAVCYENSHPTEYERSHAVARMLMGGSLCTGWRVGDDNRMFTNEHCMNSQSAVSGSEAWFNYQNSTCGGNQLAGTVKVSGDQLLATDYALDYTLFTVNNFSSIESFGNLGLDVRTPSLGEEIYIPQHGSGNPKELAIESDQNSGNICRIDDAVANGRGNNTDTGYFCDTIGGSSGSPVLARSSHKAIALHHFGGCTNQGVRIDLIWPEVSSFFPNGIPQGSGGGVEPPSGPSLSTNGYKVKGKHVVDLTWSNAATGSVEIYRDGALIATTANDGAYTDNTGNKGKATYVYQVCETGGGDCSNTSTVTF